MNRNDLQCRGKCREQLRLLRALDFAIQETALYLDGNPDCREALNYYHALCDQRKNVLASYEKHCAPITVCGNESRTSWDWAKSPWPWEYDENDGKGCDDRVEL